MIKYFKELLTTLKDIAETNRKIEKHLSVLQETVKTNSRGHGARKFMATGHWND